MAERVIAGRPIVEGEAEGEALVTSEALSFWGGYDFHTGTIIDKHHPLAGVEIVAAPERQRVARHERFALGLAGDDDAAGNHALCHSDSSRTTRPSIAEWTQSARLPKVTRVWSRLGA